MKIRKLHLDGFGIFHDTEIGEFADGINLIYAPNEAGKSTLLDFIRYTLFGYPRSHSDRRPPLSGGNHGGRIWLQSRAGDELVVHREGTRKNAYSVELAGSSESGESLLSGLFGDASADLYRNVYALTLDELRGLEQLSESGMENRIFSMGMGLGSLDYGAFEQDLQKRREDYYKPRGKTQQLIQLAGEIEELDGVIRRQSAKLEDYERLSKSLEERQKAYGEAREKQFRARKALEKARTRAKAFPVIVEWRKAKEDEDSLVSYADKPREVLEVFRENQSRLKQLEANLRSLEEEEAQHQREGRKFATLTEVPVEGAALVELTAEAGKYSENLGERETLRQQVEKLQSEQQKRWERMGTVEDRDRILTMEGLYRLRQNADAQQTRRSQRENGKRDILRQQEDVQRRQEQLREGEEELIGLRKKAGWPADEELARRKEWLSRAEFDLQQALAQPLGASRSLISDWAVLLASVVAMVAGVLLWPGQQIGAVVIGAVGFGMLMFELYTLWRKRGLTSSPVDARQLHREIEETKAMLAKAGQWQAEMDKLAKDRAEQKSRLRQTTSRLESFAVEEERDQDQWLATLEEYGLPHDLEPSGMGAFLGEVEAIQSLVREETVALRNLSRCEEQIHKFLDRVCREEPELGEEPEPPQIDGWLAKLRENQELAQEKKVWENQGQSLTERKKRLLSGQEKLQGDLEEAMKLVGAGSVEEFYLYYQRLEEKAECRKNREQAEKSLQTLFGIEDWIQESESLAVSTPEQLESRKAEAEAELNGLEAEVEELNREVTELQQKRKFLLEPDDLFACRNRVATLRNELGEKVREWLATKLALEMLGRAKQRYEEAHQPVVLRETRKFFSRITAGAYQDLRLSLTEKHVSLVTARGETRGVAELSRGTREQLLLALRLGLIAEYEQNREPLPMVLDDLLVNFDPDRASRIARVLTDFSAGRQVILFTCHPHTKDLFTDFGAQVVNL